MAPQPTELDFVTNFLLQTKEGYCTYFASAMTVLCRMVGLPARYVEGYVAEPDAEGHAVVTGMEGHAWTEVYFSGFGWLTFDATPRAGNGASDSDGDTDNDNTPPPEDEPTPEPSDEPEDEPDNQPTIAPPEETPTPEPEPSSEPTPEPSEAPENPPEEPVKGPNLWWLLLLLLVIAAVALRIFLTQPRQAAARAKDEQGRWMAWTQALYDALRVLKLPRQKNESPMAYMARLDQTAQLPAALYQLGIGEAMMFYGRAVPQTEATFAVRQAYTTILASMSPVQKAKLTLMRAFTPRKKLDFTKA